MLHVYNPNTGWRMVLEGINRLQHHQVVRVYILLDHSSIVQ